MIRYDKSFKGVLVNFDVSVLGKLDQYKGPDKSRTRLIHEAVEFYVAHLEATNTRKSVWECQLTKRR